MGPNDRPQRTSSRHEVIDTRDAEQLSRTHLTSRERQIVDAITDGLSNRAIAERFGITERTVKNQLTVIYRKLDVASRLQLATLLLMGR